MSIYMPFMVLMLINTPPDQEEQITQQVSEVMRRFEQIIDLPAKQPCSCLSRQAEMLGRFVAEKLVSRGVQLKEAKQSYPITRLRDRLVELESTCFLDLSKEERVEIEALKTEMRALLAQSLEEHDRINAEVKARASEHITPDPNCVLCRGTGLTSHSFNENAKFDGWSLNGPYRGHFLNRREREQAPYHELGWNTLYGNVQRVCDLDGGLFPKVIITPDGSWLQFNDNVVRGNLETCIHERSTEIEEVLDKHPDATAVVVSCWWLDYCNDTEIENYNTLCEQLLPLGLQLLAEMVLKPDILDAHDFSKILNEEAVVDRRTLDFWLR